MVRTSIGAALLVTAMALPVRAEVLYHADFEDGTTNASVGTSMLETAAGNEGGTIDAVANPHIDSGNGSATVGRCSITQGYSRAEFTSQHLPTQGQVRRYRWSYLLLDDFFDGADINWLANAQWKTWPCEVCNADYDPDICGGCGGIFNDLGVDVDDGNWNFRYRAEPDCYEHTQPVTTGQWVRFEMLVYWTMAFDGYVRLWRDDVLVYSLDDIRTLFTSFEEGTCDMYFAVGLYANWSGDKERLDLYIDDIEITDEADGGPTDGGPSDGGPSDGGPTDGGPSDGGTDGGTEDPSQVCEQAFGDVSEFVLCEATAETCTFNAAKADEESCSTICLDHGNTCLTSYSNSTAAPCVTGETLACDLVGHIDDICVCGHAGTDDAGPTDSGPSDSDTTDDSGPSSDAGASGDSNGGCGCRTSGPNRTTGTRFLIALLLDLF